MIGSTNASSGGSNVSFCLDVTVSCTGLSDLSGISVTATPTASGYATAQGTTDSSGKAVLTVSQGGTYTVSASRSGCSFTSKTGVTTTELTTSCAITGFKYGEVTVTVKDEKSSGFSATVTATCSGQATQMKTLALSGTSQSVTFTGLAAGTWTFSTTYPSSATGADSKTVTIEYGGTYSVSLAIVYVVLYGYQIDQSVGDSKSRVSFPSTIYGYTNKAASVTTATGVNSYGTNGWDSVTDTLIKGIKKETKDGDKMVYFPTWWKKKTTTDGVTTIAYADTRIDDTWQDYAGTNVNGTRVGYFYVGQKLGTVSSSKLYSNSTSTPTVSTSITSFISYATARGSGYDIMTWFQWDYITDLLPMIFGTTNLQTIMYGYCSGHSSVTSMKDLDCDALGMYGSSSDGRMAAFWVEDLWGNALQFVGGARTDGSYNLWVRFTTSAVTDPTAANGWTKACDASIKGSYGYISGVAGTTIAGNFPTAISGSSSTYYADYGYVNSSGFPRVGGYYNNGDYAGPFYAGFNASATGTNTNVGSRLSYRGA